MRSAETRAEALFLCQQCNLRREEINLRSVPAAALASEGEQQMRRMDSGRQPAQKYLPWTSHPANSLESAGEQKAAYSEVQRQGCLNLQFYFRQVAANLDRLLLQTSVRSSVTRDSRHLGPAFLARRR